MNSVIISPMLTEKATQNASVKVYTFHVTQEATKNSVKTSLESLYKVKIKDVRMMVRKGKSRRVGRKMVRKSLPDIKIAYVYVKEGTIDVFPKA